MHNYGLSSLAADAKLTAKIQTVMVNFYLDFPTDTAFTPYVQAGVGGAYVDAKSTVNVHGVTSVTDANGGWWTGRPDGAGDIDGYDGIGTYAGGFNQRYTGQQNSWNLAWNVGAGFAYQLKDNIAMDLSYRYSYFGEAEFGTRGYNVLANGQRNPAYDVATGATWGDLGEQIIGRTSSKSSVKLDAHEVIVGLRFTGW